MNLLKQNTVDGLILKQNVDGKALKQNYNFGNSLESSFPSGISLLIECNIPVGQPFSIGFFNKVQPGSSAYPFLNSNLGGNSLIFTRNDVAGVLVKYNNSSTLVFGTVVVPSGLLLATYNGTSTFKGFNGASYNSISAAPLSSPITSLIISSPSKYNYNLINNLFVFNRELTIEEAVYLHNNRLGNEFLNTSDLQFVFSDIKASIISPGVIGIIGTGVNAIFNGLPAGTDEQKVNYANANIFERW